MRGVNWQERKKTVPVASASRTGMYDEIRHVYLPHLDNIVKDIIAFSRLMNSGEMITKSLAKYIYYAFKLRREKLVEFAYYAM